MTFSVVGRHGDSFGVAVASKFLAVGNAVPVAEVGVGAIATQAYANLSYRPDGLAMLRAGRSAEETLAALTAADDGRDQRQAGVVDSAGRAATYTGPGCHDWAGGRSGDGYAIQGNILTGEDVVLAMEAAWLGADPDVPFARRLLAALTAGDAAGGDRRGRQSAAILVVREGAGYGGNDDIAFDLRVDDHPSPIPELARLLDLNDLYLTASTEEEQVTVTDELRHELEERAQALGHADFHSWVGAENYEMRVAPDLAWIDQHVLEIIRTAEERQG